MDAPGPIVAALQGTGPDIGLRDHFFANRADSSPSRQRFQSIYRTLRERITLLRYPPGKKLDIDRLAEEFEVSRTPIRSVLQRLEYQGLVVTRHGVGTTVTGVGFEHLREATVFRMRLAELIGELSPLAPQASAVEAMQNALEGCQALRGRQDLEEFGRIDIQVHECICSVIGHPLLYQVYDELYYRTARMWSYFLPRLDWASEIEIFQGDIEAQMRTMQRGDIRGVGFLVRNAVSAAVIRFADIFEEVKEDTADDVPAS